MLSTHFFFSFLHSTQNITGIFLHSNSTQIPWTFLFQAVTYVKMFDIYWQIIHFEHIQKYLVGLHSFMIDSRLAKGQLISECPLAMNYRRFHKVYYTNRYQKPRTTDAQRGNSLHCTAENSLPLPNFQVRPKQILSATSAQFFRYL